VVIGRDQNGEADKCSHGRNVFEVMEFLRAVQGARQELDLYTVQGE
jgi:hypothetical protein